METIMSEFSKAIGRRHSGADSFPRRIGGALQRCWLAYMDWRVEQMAIRRLRRMSDRELKDIGLLRSQIEFEVRGGAAGHPMISWRFY
jgi:uncharacterized protein YjiS (DUF1127 family)